MMFGGEDLPTSTVELRIFLEKMRNPAFRYYFETVVDERLDGDGVVLTVVNGRYQWQKKK